ncbi:MAG: MerR family transcriptional regulator [Candidatus Gastranaerophilales bacterium]|nr:MerR family transcriptional regulator [Candidatus Gastranaerophilales bacterium]
MNLAEGTNQSNKYTGKVYTPDEVRNILSMDAQDISNLCKQVYVSPKRDRNTGKTFFLENDVEILKKIKGLHNKGQQIAEQKNLPAQPPATIAKKPAAQAVKEDITAIANAIIESQESIVEKLSNIIDEKLDGMDEVVVELIRCKTENEKLRQKMNNLTKENYELKNQAEQYIPLGFGFYVKR